MAARRLVSLFLFLVHYQTHALLADPIGKDQLVKKNPSANATVKPLRAIRRAPRKEREPVSGLFMALLSLEARESTKKRVPNENEPDLQIESAQQGSKRAAKVCDWIRKHAYFVIFFLCLAFSVALSTRFLWFCAVYPQLAEKTGIEAAKAVAKEACASGAFIRARPPGVDDAIFRAEIAAIFASVDDSQQLRSP